MEQILTTIREFLHRSFRHRPFADDEDIFESGMVNSLFALQIVMFIEKTFSFEIDQDELRIENFASIAAMGRLVAAKQVGTAGAGGRTAAEG